MSSGRRWAHSSTVNPLICLFCPFTFAADLAGELAGRAGGGGTRDVLEKDLGWLEDSPHPAIRNIASPATVSPRSNRVIAFSRNESILCGRIGEG